MDGIWLASRSPRRRELLRQIGVPFGPLDIEVDERRQRDEAPAAMVERLARTKAQAGAAQALDTDRLVLAADTAVALDGEILGKPADRDDALAMLERLSGREHEVYSGVAVALDAELDSCVVRSTVRLRPITATERTAYWATGEPADKAGAYAIQGRGAVFVEHLAGSYSNVVGLPLCETATLLVRFGVDPLILPDSPAVG